MNGSVEVEGSDGVGGWVLRMGSSADVDTIYEGVWASYCFAGFKRGQSQHEHGHERCIKKMKI